jgi:hypothetical protein
MRSTHLCVGNSVDLSKGNLIYCIDDPSDPGSVCLDKKIGKRILIRNQEIDGVKNRRTSIFAARDPNGFCALAGETFYS